MRCILVLGVLLAAVGGALALGSSSTPAGHKTTLVSEETMPGGAVKREWSNGATFVGDADAVVTFTENAAGEATGAAVTVPGVASAEALAARVRAYRRAGRSPEKDMRAAGMPLFPRSLDTVVRPVGRTPILARNYGTPNVIYDSGCVALDRSDAYWRGCFTRKGTASSDCCAFYLADSSQASGHAKAGGHWLIRGGGEQRYATGTSIIQWSPGSDINSSSCTETTVGLSGYGVTLSRGYTRCPKVIHIDVTSTKFNATWQGCKGSATSPGVAEAAFTRVPTGKSPTLVYSIAAYTQPWSC
jgi:hypothetical protein